MGWRDPNRSRHVADGMDNGGHGRRARRERAAPESTSPIDDDEASDTLSKLLDNASSVVAVASAGVMVAGAAVVVMGLGAGIAMNVVDWMRS